MIVGLKFSTSQISNVHGSVKFDIKVHCHENDAFFI